MGFKITLIVLCVLISCLCLIEAAKETKHKKHYKHKEHERTKHSHGRAHKEKKIKKEDRLQVVRLTRATHGHAEDRQVEASAGFNFNFSNIPGGAGVQMIFDNMKNVFMAVNRVLNFGFIWDGVTGIISLFNIRTGATFVINGLSKMGGFVGYMLTDVTDFITAITSGTSMIVKSALDLLRSTIRFASNTVANLVVNGIDLVNALLGVTKQNLKDILGPVYKLVSTAFKPLFDAVGQLANSVGNGVMAILEPILGAIRSVTSPIVNVLSAVLRKAGGIFDNGLFRGIADGLRSVVQNVVGGVVGGVKGVTSGVFSALTGAINGVGSVFQNAGDAIGSIVNRGDNEEDEEEMDTSGYTSIETTTIVDEEPIQFTYANITDEYFQHFIREGYKEADVVIIYKGAEGNFIAFYNRLKGAVFIINGNTGRIGIFDINNGAGILFLPNSTTGYAIQPPRLLRADFQGPNAKNVSDALTALSLAIDELNMDLDRTVDMVTFDIIEVLRTLTLKNLLSSVLTGEALMVVGRMLGNLLRNLADALPPIIRPSLGVANTLLPFLLNLPENFINGIISLIGNVVKRFLGLFTPVFVAELAKTVVIAALKGLTTPMLAPLLTPIGTISTSINLGLTAAQTAVDLLGLP